MTITNDMDAPAKAKVFSATADRNGLPTKRRTGDGHDMASSTPKFASLFENTPYEGEWVAIDERVKQIDKMREEYWGAAHEMAVLQTNIAAELSIVREMLEIFEAKVKGDEQLAKDSRQADFMEGLAVRHRLLTEVSKVLPQKNSMILSLAVGDINVTLPRLGDRMKYKHNYELFKLKMTLVAFSFTFLRLLLDTFTQNRLRVPDVMFQVFLAWYYCTVVLREHVLRANGSNIRQWWLWHHYLSIAVVAIILVWPEGETYHRFYPRFNIFACFIGFIQLLEFDYQRRRMYTLRALGKTDAMDLPSEGIQEVQWHQGLSLLLPFLVVCQIWILHMAWYLFCLSRSPQCTEWHSLALSFFFAVLGVGNIFTNITTLMNKLSLGVVTMDPSANKDS